MLGICVGHLQIIRPYLGQFFQLRKTPMVGMKKMKQIKAVVRLSHSKSRAMEHVVNKTSQKTPTIVEMKNLKQIKAVARLSYSKKSSDGTCSKQEDFTGKLRRDEPSILGPGMVLLKDYIPLDGQVEIVKECRRLGLGKGGFYRPQPGPKLHMMCLGLHWEPATYKYVKERSFDGAKPPPIPQTFIEFITSAIAAANHCLSGVPSKTLPHIEPDICLVNFYEPDRRLGVHQDKDESRKSLDKGLPVVSISLGDSAIFLYGNSRDLNKMRKVVLKSGDVLLFGGESRLVFHGVESIIPSSAPHELIHATNLRPGRLALTFRKY